MGTTLTVAGTLGSDLVIGHIGDSRAYLLRGNTFKQLTTDHTLAQALIDAGVANSDDPAPRSMRHVLTAAIGSLDERIEPQVQRFRLYGGDQLLSARTDLQRWLTMTSLPKCSEKQNRQPLLAKTSLTLRWRKVELTTSPSWWPALIMPREEPADLIPRPA